MEKRNNECPTSCPFLGIRSFLPETLPFYCEKYNTYLGVSPAKKVVKCPLCLGIKVAVQQQGLELLENVPNCVSELKKAFLSMRPADQEKLVNSMAQFGIKVNWPKNKAVTPVNLLMEINRLAYEKKSKEKSPEVQEFRKLLDLTETDGDPMDSNTKTLLSNLFQVLDNSEKGMLLSILENPNNAKSFLDIFLKMPHDQNLLKNFRMLLYDSYEKTKEKSQGNRLLVTEKGKALNLSQSMHLQHLMQMMIQARSKNRTRS
ncbi:MAG: hypothetical protein IKQ99_01160 [Alphaproteobacteria bacterium]|nr:hypothetical protein [Alphaproteobacteria bacterium]